MHERDTYRTFLRSARNFEEFSRAEKIQQDTGLTWQEARDRCQAYNAHRSSMEVELGTKLEFEEE